MKRYYTDIQLSSSVKPGYQPSWRKLFIHSVVYVIYALGLLAIVALAAAVIFGTFLIITGTYGN